MDTPHNLAIVCIAKSYVYVNKDIIQMLSFFFQSLLPTNSSVPFFIVIRMKQCAVTPTQVNNMELEQDYHHDRRRCRRRGMWHGIIIALWCITFVPTF